MSVALGRTGSATMGTMTDVLSRPVLRVEDTEPRPPRSVVLSSVAASMWVVSVGLVGCVVLAVAAWFAADTGSFADATRIGGLAWLVGGGSGLVVDGATLGLVPLGFVLVVALMLHRGGRWVVQRCDVRRPRDAGVAIAAISTSYALAAVVAALIARTDAAHVGLVRAAAAGLLVAGLAGGSGVLRESGLLRTALQRLPDDVQAIGVGAVAGLMAIVTAAGLLFTATLIVHFDDAVALAEGLGAGYVGGAVVAVIGLTLVPNAVLCAGAFLAGPGFAVGEGTVVAPGEVDLGPLPPLPLLAALPDQADGWWVDVLAVVPVLAGLAAGALAVRRWPVFAFDRAALRGAGAGLTGGVLFGLSTVLSTGAAGPGRFAEMGPDVLAVTAVCAVAGLVGGAVGGLASWWLRSVVAGRGD